MKWPLVLATLIVLTLVSAAHADHITDPATDFAIDFDVKDATVCVLFPPERVSGGTCGKLRPEQVAAAFENVPNKPVYAARVRFGTWQFFITITSDPAEDIDDVDAYTRGNSRSITARGVEIFQPSTARRTVVNGIPVIALSVGTRWLDGGAEQWISTYALCGSQANYTIFAATDTAEHAREMSALVETALTTVKLAPVHPRAAMPTVDVIGYTLRGLAAAGMLVFAVWFVSRQLAKRSARPKPERPRVAPPTEEPRFKRKPSKKIVWDRDRDGP